VRWGQEFCLAEAEAPDAATRIQWESSYHQSPEEAVYRAECRELVARGIEALPGHYREAMRLRYVKDRSYAEIVHELQVPMGTVKTWLCRGRRQLRGEFLKLGVWAML
jgi:RNA polymerase sigma factor (sigma-70 family)